MKLLISGSTGFVGTNLRKYLSPSNEIIGVSRTFADHPTLHYKDLDSEALSDFHAFIHLAGKAHDTKRTTSSEEYYKINTELTKKVFDFFLNSKCEIFIFVSSVKAVSDKPEGILDESVIPKPATSYGKSKLAAENYILNQDIPANKNVYILRPCMIHGPGNKGNLNLLYKIVSKIPYPLGKFENRRSFLSIQNFCFIMEQLLQKKINSGIYNVADDQVLSTNELVVLIGRTMNKKVSILKFPKKLVLFISKLGDILPLPINSDRLEKLTENYVVSNDKIKQVLQIERLPINGIEGLENTIKSFIK